MIFQDNIIKSYLENVYFITGTPCGGKTTVSRELAKKHNIRVYDIDEMFPIHQQLSDKEHQPDMNKEFKDADEFFGRSVEEYRQWLIDNTRQQLDFVILDLIRLAKEGPVICDCHLTLEQAEILTDPSRIVFMVREPKDLVDEYCNRPDHQGFSDFIHSATDYEKAKATCNATLQSLNEQRYKDILNSEYCHIERDYNRSVEDTVRLVEKHFGWDDIEDVSIEKVGKDSELAAKLLKFVEECSWVETKQHVAENIRNWVYTDWETIFAAVKNGRIIGITSVMKEDYYPMPDTFPWVSCVFVSEEYRGHALSGRLIETANSYLREQGFDISYIPSEHMGLYEHYGYQYVKDIVNYGGFSDHLFSKDI